MKHSFKAESTTWWLTHDGKKVTGCGTLRAGQEINSGQPKMETFDNPLEYRRRLAELGETLEIERGEEE